MKKGISLKQWKERKPLDGSDWTVDDVLNLPETIIESFKGRPTMKKTKAREWELILGMGVYYNGKEVHYAKGPIVDAPLPNPGTLKVIEKTAFDELLKLADRMKKEVFCAALGGASCTVTEPCAQCRLLDDFHQFKKDREEG